MKKNDLLVLEAAQNRTTKAVRAIAIFVLYSALFSLIGGIVIGISSVIGGGSGRDSSSAMVGIVLGAVIVAGGYGFGLFKAFSELDESRVDRDLLVHESDANQQFSEDGDSDEEESSTESNATRCQNCGTINALGKLRCVQCLSAIE
jgi:hypothetical protein